MNRTVVGRPFSPIKCPADHKTLYHHRRSRYAEAAAVRTARRPLVRSVPLSTRLIASV